MASAVDICNLALAHLSDEATVSSISPSDGSVQADHCVRFYPIARDVVLEMHPWSFATKRIALTELDTDELPDSWGFAYSLPNLCLRVWKVLLPSSTDDNDTQEFVIETLQDGTEVIFTNAEDATVVYTTYITDTTKFKPLVVNALSWLLASYLALPITKNPKIKESCYKMFLTEFGKAAVADSTARRHNSYGANHTPAHLAARQ